MKQITAVIPVRQGSQRVQNKNFRKFGGKSLLEHKIEMIKQLPVNDIIINTDSKYAIEIAKKEGVSYHNRHSYYASSECTNSEYHHYLAESTKADHILIAQVTAPLIKHATFIEALDLYHNHDCNSLMSVKPVKEYLWFENKPVNYKLDYAPNSQDLPNYFAPTFGIIICNREAMLKSRNFICDRPYFYEVSELESIDIDTTLDFEFAEYMFNKNNG